MGFVRNCMIWTAGALVTVGCYSGINPDNHGGGGESDSGGASGGTDTTGGADDVDPRSTSPGVRLLTQREFRNAVYELLGVEIERTEIPREQLIDGHGHIARGQGVGLEEVERYYDLALAAAEQALPTLDAGCDLSTATCAAAFAEDFLRRAFREPLTVDTRDRYLAILEAPDAGTTIDERLETLIAAALTSPHFLYRRELGDEPVEGHPVARWLTDHEIAARLSFLVWQTGPDEELLAAAEAGLLRDPDQRVQQLERMLADDRARVGQLGFAIDWVGAEAGGTIDDKDPEVLAGASADLRRQAERSLERTIQHALFDGAGTYTGLLSTDEYWVEQEVAALLDLPPAGSELEPRTLDPEVRQGVLMHPSVLAAHTKESGASPFTIGKFVYENVLCGKIGPPAVDLPEIDPSDLEDKTLREVLEELTSPAECQGCHGVISPPGFAFLSFDPVGRHSLEDGYGRPFDTSGTLPVGQGAVSFENAAELSVALAGHDATADCLTRRLYRWTFGHFEAPDTAPYVETLSAAAVASETAVDPLLTDLVRSDEFAQVRLGE